jgi:hypothetical protein
VAVLASDTSRAWAEPLDGGSVEARSLGARGGAHVRHGRCGLAAPASDTGR